MSEATETTSTSTPMTQPSAAPTPESKVSSEPVAVQKPALSEAAPEVKEEVKPAENAANVDEFEEYELNLFEGSSLTEEDLDEIAAEASRLNLNKEDAEKLLKIKDAAFKKAISQKEQEYSSKIEKARKEIENDPDFIGDKKDQSFASISRAVKQFGDNELIALLNTPEVGNNLVIAKFLKRIGDAIAPDDLPGKGVTTNPAQDNNQSLKSWYPEFFK